MKGFEIERTKERVYCSMETLPEKILKIPGIAIVAAGSLSCLSSLYDCAKDIKALDRLFLCRMTPMEYSLGKQGQKIWQAVENACQLKGIRGIIIYASCMEVLTMWDFENEKKKKNFKVPVSILYRGPMVKRFVTPDEEFRDILREWNLEENSSVCFNERIQEKLPLPYFVNRIEKLSKKDCDILLFTPGGCRSCLKCLPEQVLTNVWNTRFSDYSLGSGKLIDIAQKILEHFNTERPLYLLGSAVTQFTGMDLERIASWLRKMNKEAYYEDILEENLDTRLF